jgi:hypothetical protein
LHGASELIRAIAALAWPVIALVAVLVFRRQLANVLSTAGPLRRMKVGPLEAEWERQRAEAEAEVEAAGVVPPEAPPDLAEELKGLAKSAPSAAILEAYAHVEDELRAMLQAADVPAAELPGGGALRLARFAAQRGLLNNETVSAVGGIAVLRNMAAHGHMHSLSQHQALDYLTLADSVLYAIRNPPRL